MEVIYIGKTINTIRTYPYHRHHSWEIIITFEGNGTAIIDGVKRDFSPGMVFLIPPETPHQLISGEGYADASIMIRDLKSSIKKTVICTDDGNNTVVRLYELAYESFYKNNKIEGMAESICNAIYQFILNRTADTIKTNGVVEMFERKLFDNISNCDFDIAAEIEKTGYSRNHFRKMFKDVLGTTPVEYMQRIRIEFAKQQIATYSEKVFINNIALLSGFADPYYFSRVLKKIEGVSPREYLILHAEEKNTEVVSDIALGSENRDIEVYGYGTGTKFEEMVE